MLPQFTKKIILIANYSLDNQRSMLRYAHQLYASLERKKISVEIVYPTIFLGHLLSPRSSLFKWLAYIDKMILFPFLLWLRLKKEKNVIIHICDHSNAYYSFFVHRTPCIVTCHDAGAIRGAWGDLEDCPASFLGVWLQKLIVAGLNRADKLICVSESTREDIIHFALSHQSKKTSTIPNYLIPSWGKLTSRQAQKIVQSIYPNLGAFILSVGSDLERKNRICILRTFAEVKKHQNIKLILVGPPLSPQLKELATQLELQEKDIVIFKEVDEITLAALYSQAFAFLFPSRFEGFGWPVIEAQASGCPVLTSNASSLPEAAGNGAYIYDADDDQAFAAGLIQLSNDSERANLIRKGRENSLRFSENLILTQWLKAYASL